LLDRYEEIAARLARDGSLMAYVPGFQNDLFLSYAHGDNAAGWISALHERLKIRLRELLGVSPAIWRDERRLGGETDFAEEIRRQVANTAVVIAVVSPSYLSSAYCRLERQAFSTAAQPPRRTQGRHQLAYRQGREDPPRQR
jgi:hypothetical protein